MTRITAPRPVAAPPAFRFPVVASLAPLVIAVVLWLVTGSPYTLLFALLGPVTAVAGLVDARLGGRRAAHRERARFDDDARSTHVAIDAAHAEERAVLAERTPSAVHLLTRARADPWRWRCRGPEVPVALGLGAVASAVAVDGDDILGQRAAVLSDAPVVVDAALGIGVVGPPVLAAAVARALVMQVSWALSPADFSCTQAEEWMAALPHATDTPARPAAATFTQRESGTAVVTIASARSSEALPAQCRVVLAVTPEAVAIVQHPDRARRVAVRPEAVSARAAAAWASGLADEARRAGVVASSSGVPDAVPLGPLLGPPQPSGLACAIGADARGPAVIDLVADGPHAVVGGTTGSGKSELLVSWVVAMAAIASPERLTVLLVDFKGGAAFAPLAGLPHTVGTVTDLDDDRAARALASLRAELRYRERALARVGARDVSEVDDLPRLVIVVDEFAAVLAEHPELHALFADLASRGRSLGVHLILCTQRPASAVRDAVLANTDLRVCLRVNNRADSTAVVGSDAAAGLPASARGRGVIALPDADPRVVQFALATDADVRAVTARWAHVPAPRRPWCEPLPSVVEPHEAPGGFGLLDLPEQQRRDVARWSPDDGHLLVLGAARSGVSTALAAVAPSARAVPAEVAAAWDVLMGEPTGILAIDDLDSLLARAPGEYRAALIERLQTHLRDGPARGLVLVLGARRLSAELQTLAALVPQRLMLAHASRQEWVLAGADGGEFRHGLTPGAGVWRGDRVQVVRASVPVQTASAPVVHELAAGGRLAIVSTRARQLLESMPHARRLDDTSAESAAVVVGDVDDWQSRWGALAAAGQNAEIVLDGCSLADVRVLTRSRELPPPLAGLREVAWRLGPDGTITRVRFAP